MNHIDALEKQLERQPRPFPTLKIERKICDIDEFKFDDFILEGYDPHPKIAMDMAVWIHSIFVRIICIDHY